MKATAYIKEHKANEFYVKQIRGGGFMVVDGYDESQTALENTEYKANKVAAELNTMRNKRLNSNSRRGEYRPTALDDVKKSADFRITAADDLYTVEFNRPAEVRTGRSIRPASRPGVYYVTEKGLEMLKRRYTAVCDF